MMIEKQALSRFYNEIGKIYVFSIFVGVIAILAEGVGIMLLMPFLVLVTGSSDSNLVSSDSMINDWLVDEFSVSTILLLISLAFILKSLLLYFFSKMNAYIKASLVYKLRHNVYKHIKTLSYAEFAKLDRSRILNVFGEQTGRAIIAYDIYSRFLNQFLAGIIFLIISFLLNPRYTSLMVVGAVLIWPLLKYLNKSVHFLAGEIATLSNEISFEFDEFLRNFKYFSSTGQLSLFDSKINILNEGLRRKNEKVGLLHGVVLSIREPLGVIVILGCFSIEMIIFSSSYISLFVSTLFFYKSINSIMSGAYLRQQFIEYYSSYSFIDKHSDVKKDNEICMTDSNKGMSTNGGSTHFPITLTDVTIDVQGHRILNTINFEFNQGKNYVITGSSGAGKSTLVDTVLGLTNISYGRVTYGLLCNESQIARSMSVGFVPQEPDLLTGSVLQNISLFELSNVSDIEKQKYKRIVRLLTFLNLIDGESGVKEYLTKSIDSLQSNISGGQRQRIALIREILREPELLVLDEPTSALDYLNEEAFCKVIESELESCCVLIITHRKKILEIADATIEMLDGCIIEVTGNN
jgi:ABC-type multidrug transport system fused ATPase/permease subunit